MNSINYRTFYEVFFFYVFCIVKLHDSQNNKLNNLKQIILIIKITFIKLSLKNPFARI